MPDTATLSAKFQISIPKAVRNTLHWKAGQKFAFIPKGTGVMLVPVPEAADLAGIAQGAKAEDYRDCQVGEIEQPWPEDRRADQPAATERALNL